SLQPYHPYNHTQATTVALYIHLHPPPPIPAQSPSRFLHFPALTSPLHAIESWQHPSYLSHRPKPVNGTAGLMGAGVEYLRSRLELEGRCTRPFGHGHGVQAFNNIEKLSDVLRAFHVHTNS